MRSTFVSVSKSFSRDPSSDKQGDPGRIGRRPTPRRSRNLFDRVLGARKRGSGGGNRAFVAALVAEDKVVGADVRVKIPAGIELEADLATLRFEGLDSVAKVALDPLGLEMLVDFGGHLDDGDEDASRLILTVLAVRPMPTTSERTRTSTFKVAWNDSGVWTNSLSLSEMVPPSGAFALGE